MDVKKSHKGGKNGSWDLRVLFGAVKLNKILTLLSFYPWFSVWYCLFGFLLKTSQLSSQVFAKHGFASVSILVELTYGFFGTATFLQKNWSNGYRFAFMIYFGLEKKRLASLKLLFHHFEICSRRKVSKKLNLEVQVFGISCGEIAFWVLGFFGPSLGNSRH